MASIFLIKEKLENPMKWFAESMELSSEWEFDDITKLHHLGDIYLRENHDSVSFEDTSESTFFGWETAEWIALAGGKELIYGYYSDDSGSAEFLHIKNGKCIREFRIYDFENEADTDIGESPEFQDWADVAEYVDGNLL